MQDELVQYVCDHMPVRSRLLGRAKVSAVVGDVVQRWPGALLVQLNADGQQTLVSGVASSLAKERRSGSILLLWSLSIIVQLVWQWWLSRSANQMKMYDWQRQMRGES